MLAVAVGTADDPKQNAVTSGEVYRKIVCQEEDTFTSAPTHINSRDAELGHGFGGELQKANIMKQSTRELI
jgi:hypothetical protein